MKDINKTKQSSSHEKKKSTGGFQSMGFSWQILKSIFNSGYKQATPIQRKAIPEILLGKDVVAMARTGSGKTAAFLLPMFQRLHEQETTAKAGPKALIMSPTRELALQTFKFAKQFGKYSDFKVAVILGGDKIEDQFETLHENPDIIIATPGRFLHICVEMNYKLNTIQYVVFDEADRLFEMGFKEQLNEILHKLPSENRQTLLFSATLPQSLVEFARAGLQNPLLIRLDVDTKLSDRLKLAFLHCRLEDKLPLLIYILNNIIKAVKNPRAIPIDTKSSMAPASCSNYGNELDNISASHQSDSHNSNSSHSLSQTIIFVATRHHVEFLKDLLEHLGYHVAYAYSSLDQAARLINIAKFQNKKCSIMIVTDVAARGIDIPKLDNVINFNFPAKAKLFVHRVGRVARAGQPGNSFSLIANDEVPYMHELHEFLSRQIRFASDDMEPEDWNGVYGAVPQSIVDIERDFIESLIESKVELKSAFGVQENAYKHYLKSRPLADSFNVRAAKNMRLLHPVLSIHPLFKTSKEMSNTFSSEEHLLDKLKNYTSKGTIFETNKSTIGQKGARVMRNKRERDEKFVNKYKSMENNEENVSLFRQSMYSIHDNAFKKSNDDDQDLEDNHTDKNDHDEEYDNDDLDDYDQDNHDRGEIYYDNVHANNNIEIQKISAEKRKNQEMSKKFVKETGVFMKKFNDQELIVTISNNNEEISADDIKTDLNLTKKAAKRKLQLNNIIDKEHFIPYKSKNFSTEKAMEINSNFNKEISNAAMDLVADDETEIRRNMQKMKWDRKKKKFVSNQSTLDKSKKIKTESGRYINASYKSNLYAKWLKISNKGGLNDNYENDDENRNDNRVNSKKSKQFFGSSLAEKKYFGSHKFKSKGKPGVKRFKTSSYENSKHKVGDDQKLGRRARRSSQNEKNGQLIGSKKNQYGTGLKNKDQIIKERNRKEKIKIFQNRNKTTKGSKGNFTKKSSKKSFLKITGSSGKSSKKPSFKTTKKRK